MGNESTEISESSLHTISDFEIKLEVEDQSPISILQDIEAIIDQRNIKSNAPKAIKSFCVICQEGFSSKRHLKKHVMEVHKEQYLKELYKHTCDICQTQFKHQKELIKYFEEIHKDQKPFACGECNFRTKVVGKYYFWSNGSPTSMWGILHPLPAPPLEVSFGGWGDDCGILKQ